MFTFFVVFVAALIILSRNIQKVFSAEDIVSLKKARKELLIAVVIALVIATSAFLFQFNFSIKLL